jgi:hypothetical protein
LLNSESGTYSEKTGALPSQELTKYSDANEVEISIKANMIMNDLLLFILITVYKIKANSEYTVIKMNNNKSFIIILALMLISTSFASEYLVSSWDGSAPVFSE